MMMFIQYIKFVSFTLVVTLCISCSDNEFSETNHDSALAVNAQIFQGRNDTYISVSQSFGLGDTLFYADLELDNIDVTLNTPDQGIFAGFSTLVSNSNDGLFLPIWQFDYTNFIAGGEYTFRAEKEGLEPVIATVYVPEKPTIIDVEYTPSVSNSSVVRDRFELTLSDPANEDNYYYVRAFELIDDGRFERDFRFYSLPANPIDQSFLEEVITSFSDKDFNGREHTVVFYGERIKRDQEKVQFQLFQITKDHYDFIQDYNKFNNDSPISEPVIFNSNIIGGHGIFAISSKPDFVEF